MDRCGEHSLTDQSRRKKSRTNTPTPANDVDGSDNQTTTSFLDFKPKEFKALVEEITEALKNFGILGDFPAPKPKKTPLQELTERVWAEENLTEEQDVLLSRYANYEQMDAYPTISTVLGGYAEDAQRVSTPRTPLQELTERVWSDSDPTDDCPP